MDCTYKTNKYKMPLLDIIGVSSFNTSFYSCFVFMQKEEKDYVWALEMFNKILGVHNQPLVIISDRELALMKTIHIVFPSACNLLCMWHIEKNILANCKPHFREEVDWVAFLSTWADLIKSPNESSFDKAWDRNRATSRAEDAHATLKKYLQVSTGGLREMSYTSNMKLQNMWRINAQLLNNDQHASLDDEDDQINSLLLDFKEKYEKLPILQKDDTKRQLSQFVGTSFPKFWSLRFNLIKDVH
ncbi:unnamed protein product [Prunus armeniaca]